jgi:hypothetical protein
VGQQDKPRDLPEISEISMTHASERRDSDGAGTERRPYHSPTLTCYGSVAKLTQGTRTVGNDGAMGGMMMMCL